MCEMSVLNGCRYKQLSKNTYYYYNCYNIITIITILGSTCLHILAAADLDGAFQYNLSSLIQVLADFGADLNSKDIDGNSPAHISAERGNYEEVELLVSGSWWDSHNVKGEIMQSILNRRIAQAERKRTDRWNRTRFNEIVKDVRKMMETLRFREKVNADVVDNLNEKIPEALKATR